MGKLAVIVAVEQEELTGGVMWIKRFLCAVIVGLSMISGITHGDDTDLFSFIPPRPQVMIIFDTSGSMNRDVSSEAFYNSNTDYSLVNGLNKDMLYFTKDALSMPGSNSSDLRRFSVDINGCGSSWAVLEEYGMFSGFFREYSFSGQQGSWQEIPDNNGANSTVIDCFEDIEAGEWRNALDQPDGFPVDSAGDKKDPVRYTEVNVNDSSDIADAIEKAKSTAFGAGHPITLYTANYLGWYYGIKSTQDLTREQVAKEVINNTIIATAGVDFGVASFNGAGTDKTGGRISSPISNDKNDLIDVINNFVSDGGTPTTPALYEVYLYFAGKNLKWGINGVASARENNRYISPFNGCQNSGYVIYMTDGIPTARTDGDADSLVKGLRNIDSTYYGTVDFVDDNNLPGTSYAAVLAGWMNTNDVNTTLEGTQSVTTYTIGFSDGADGAADLLTKMAELGGGEYYTAEDSTELQVALTQIFSGISLEANASFISPSVASNNFDRTQNFDAVYYAMFQPNTGPRWMGNLKKFKVNDEGDIVDKNGDAAIASDGSLKSSACSYWTPNSVCLSSSGGGDGNDVSTGGVAHVVRTGGTRTIYGNFGSGGELEAFTKSNASIFAEGDEALASYMNTEVEQLATLFDWARGIDVDDDDGDNSVTDKREDIIGDPLHSKPLAINFGTSDSPDIRIIMGTNHGFLHMFKDSGDDVSETWAFMPYELLPNISKLKTNSSSGGHSVYGMDSSVVSYIKTKESGEIGAAWVFSGMRRGGKSYYALDITDPDDPKFLWKIDSESEDMSQLAQTWSEPIVTFIPGWPADNTDASLASPVLIFGAGYSPSTKDSAVIGSEDFEGKGVFIVDAETGKLVHFFGPTSGTKMTEMPGIIDSIPNSVAVLDANGDGLTDRIYATDTGGNIWRMDLPGADSDTWTAFKFAELGGGELTSDRRFFAEPVIAQTVFTNLSEVEVMVNGETTDIKTYQNVAYDAVVVGTGHRPHPLDFNREDMFYMLQDRNITSRSFNGEEGNEVPDTLTLSNLYNITGSEPDDDTENIKFGLKRGWYYEFGSGEKSLAAAAIIEGNVYFTSYIPPEESSLTTQCLIAGEARLYGFDLHKGARTFGENKEYIEIGDRLPDTPQMVVVAKDGESNIYLIGIGDAADEMINMDNGCSADAGDSCVGGGLSANRIYYHINE